MALGVASLSTSESLPVSLLTPIAADLGVSAGAAGQAITASASVAFATSLIVAWATRRVNRRFLLLALTAIQVLSTLTVALAPSLPVLLIGRMLLGFALGAFWSLSASLALRLAAGPDVPKALSIIFGGSSVAGIAAAPLGSYLGGIVGWRGVFLAALVLGGAALLAQALTLPSMPSNSDARLGTLLTVIRRPAVALGMLGIVLTFGGHRLFFTYIRPLLDRVGGGDIAFVSGLLLVFGLASFAGTTQAARLLRRDLRLTIAGASLGIAVLAALMVPASSHPVPTTVILIAWGFSFGLIPVGWSTWITRAVADQAETAGGIQVAVIQIAILVAAAVGGVIVDRVGVTGVVIAAGVVMVLAAGTVFAFVRSDGGTTS